MRTAARRAIEAAALLGAAALLRPGTRAHKLACRQLATVGRRLRYAAGRLEGLSYRLSGRHPDPEVAGTVLADRIRSSIGSLEKRLDLPHIHVLVDHHVALLHGEVGSGGDAAQLERAVAAVPGVAGVESYLHIGLARGDTRPSEGRAVHPRSPALERLLGAATGAGVSRDQALVAVRGVLGALADRLPAGERGQVAGHLPADARALFEPPRRLHRAPPARTLTDLVARTAELTPGLPRHEAEAVTAAVLGALRALVPEEAHDIAAVLPEELRALWEGARAG
jgi:uncharacterized protein (DUF2267 family)